MSASSILITRPGVSSCIISPKDNDPFFNPVSMRHTGFAADGTMYNVGVPYPILASWFSEGTSSTRGSSAFFPSIGLALLSKVDLTIYDESNRNLPLWMRFILADNLLLTNNHDGAHGFTPSEVSYAQGVISLLCLPDPGIELKTNLVIGIDFSKDTATIEFLTGTPPVPPVPPVPPPVLGYGEGGYGDGGYGG